MCDVCIERLLSDSAGVHFVTKPEGVVDGVHLLARGAFMIEGTVLELDEAGYYPSFVESQAEVVFVHGKLFSKAQARRIIESNPVIAMGLNTEQRDRLLAEIDESLIADDADIGSLVSEVLRDFRRPMLAWDAEMPVVKIYRHGEPLMLVGTDMLIGGVSIAREQLDRKIVQLHATGVITLEDAHRLLAASRQLEFAKLPARVPEHIARELAEMESLHELIAAAAHEAGMRLESTYTPGSLILHVVRSPVAEG